MKPLPLAILAGGLATRLRPLTETVPKAMLEIDGEPFIAHQLRLLRSRGIERVVICAGYLGETIRDYVGDGSKYGLDVEFSFDGPRLMGTAGAVKRALPTLGDAFFVLYGDSYLPCDYLEVRERFEESDGLALMTVYLNQNRWDTSNVEFDGRRIIAYDKVNRTPRMRHIDYGLGVFRRQAFDAVPSEEPSDLANLYRDLLRTGRLVGCEIAERFYEIGSIGGLSDFRDYVARLGAQGR